MGLRFRTGPEILSTAGAIWFLTLLKVNTIDSSNTTTSCHSQCVCLGNTSTVDCSNKSFTSFPSNLPRNLSYLLLNLNQLQTISPWVHDSLPFLNKIDLSNNPINCNCSLSWMQNGSSSLQIIGDCFSPVMVKGQRISDLSLNEMCDIKLTTASSPVEKFEEETVGLSCQSSVPVSISWWKKSGSQRQDVRALGSRFRVLQNGTLMIVNLKSSDQGDYVCWAKHKYGASGNKSLVLIVKQRPSFLRKPNNISLVEGQSGALNCQATGEGTPGVLWRYHDGGDSDLDKNHFRVLSNGTLIITNVQTEHAGTYACVISSDSKQMALATIQVHVSCKITNKTLTSGKLKVLPVKSHYVDSDVVQLSCDYGFVLNGSSVVKCLASGTWNTSVFPNCQEIILPPTTRAVSTDNVLPSTRHVVPTNDSIVRVVTTPGRQLETSASPTAVSEAQNTSTLGNSTASSAVITTPEPQTTTAGTISPTERSHIELQDLVSESNGTQLNAESLKNLVMALEEDVSRRNHSDQNKTKDFLLIASNLLRKENLAIWSEMKQTRDFSGAERLLRVVNEATTLHAKQMLNNTANSLQTFFNKFDNLDVEIYVDAAIKMAKTNMKFPSSDVSRDDYFKFPESVFKIKGRQKVAVISISFQNLEELLPMSSLISSSDSFQGNSRILSGSIISSAGDISAPVTIMFKNKNMVDAGAERTKCVFWKYSKTEANLKGENHGKASTYTKGGWSDEGCNVSSTDTSSTICHCGHLTDFAVLTRKIKEVINPSVVVYIGSSFLVIAALVAIIRHVVVWRQTRRERLLVLMNVCLAVVFAVIVFVIGVSLNYDEEMCRALASLMHFFVLAVFSWVLNEEIQLYLCVHYGWNRNGSRFKYFVLLGWVVPAIVVGITLAITQLDGYGSSKWCWYNNSLTILLTYICPIGLCILIIVSVILKITSLKAAMVDESDKRNICAILTLSGFLIPFIAATCVTAALSADQPERDVLQYLFAGFCLLLGIYMVLYHCFLDREITKVSFKQSSNRSRPKRDYYSTKETVMYSEGTSEGRNFSLVFPSRKSPEKKLSKADAKRSTKRSESATPYDYDSSVPMYPSINDSSLKSFRSQVSTQQHTLDSPPNTLSAITISRPNSQCLELTSLSDLDRRPDGAEQTDSGERSEFHGSRDSNPVEKVRQRTSGSSDCTNATTFGKDPGRPAAASCEPSTDDVGIKNRISAASSTGMSRSSVSGASLGAVDESEVIHHDDAFEKQPFLPSKTGLGPEVKSDPPAKIPKRRKRGSRRRLDDDFHEEEAEQAKTKHRQNSSSLPSTEGSVKLKQYTSF